MIPYMIGKLASNPILSTRGLVKYVSDRGYFRAVPSQNGDKFLKSPPPPIVEAYDKLQNIPTPPAIEVHNIQYYPWFVL